MTIPTPEPITVEHEPTISELAPAAVKRLQNWIATYCEKMPRAIHDDVLIVTTMALGSIKADAEITRLQAVASHAETESQAYAELATEQKGEIERLKSDNDCHRNSMKLMRVGSLALLERATNYEHEIASLKQLLADCPAKEIATMAEHTTMPDIAHMAFGIKMRSWLDARAKAIGEAGG